jgi:hypothetical protein
VSTVFVDGAVSTDDKVTVKVSIFPFNGWKHCNKNI